MTFSVIALSLLAPAQGAAAPLPFEFDVASGSGLTVKMAGLPIVRGSWFQYYAPGWKKGYYSSKWNAQKVTKVDSDTIQVSFGGEGGEVFGRGTYQRRGNRLVVNYEFGWNGKEEALVEFTPGMIWTGPFRSGSITADGTRTEVGEPPKANATEEARRVGGSSRVWQLVGPSAEVSVDSDQSMVMIDGRGYSQDWAYGKQLFWHGFSGLKMEKGKTVRVSVQYDFKNSLNVKPQVETEKPSFTKMSDVLVPNESMPVLIPRPKNETLDWNRPTEFTGGWNFPAGRVKYFDVFKEELARRFESPVLDGKKPRIAFDGGISKLKMPVGSYVLTIRNGSITVLGEEQEGLLNGLYRLASLAFCKDGRLWFPTGTVIDEPRTNFRGVHLFVGKQARDFQGKLWSRVLRPLMFNKVVLQCEQTAWDSLPGTESSITMPKTELVKLFTDYRKMEVEPIPLIQSFGHMEWFFRNNKNLDLAYNPEVPYAIDPRKPEAIAKITQVWEEAIEALKPETIHFGLDEVDMRGFSPKNPQLVTQLWEILMPELAKIKKKSNTKMMIWGDKLLAPGEAVDAALGDSAPEAQKRRNAVPKGTYIADWHYKAEPEPQPFLTSLQNLKLEGFKPIASTWSRPENVRGFYLAADLENAGTLQTTWAGYESSEKAMLAALKQFSVMVLAADYSWSARQDPLNKLPYDAEEVFAEMYNRVPAPLKARPGLTWGESGRFRIGNVNFNRVRPIMLRHIGPNGSLQPTTWSMPVNVIGNEVALALSCQVGADEGETVAEVTLVYEDGKKKTVPLVYGLHVRSLEDPETTFYGARAEGYTAIRIPLEKKPLREIRLGARSSFAGLTLKGLNVF